MSAPCPLRLAGTTGYPLMCVQCCINYRRMLAVSVGESIELATQPSLIAVASLVCTSVHCGTFVLFYQRDLLRDLVPLFDFLFTSIQFLIFSLCMCDAALWRADMVLVLFSFNLWLLWMLTLDAITPNMKRLLGFSKRHIIHVSATVLLSCVGILGLIFFTQTNPLRDRVLWSHQVSPTHMITLRVQAILIGLIITILRWCSRQTVLLLLREEDELQSIHGVVLYDNPYESFPAPRKRIKTLMQDHKTPGEGPNL